MTMGYCSNCQHEKVCKDTKEFTKLESKPEQFKVNCNQYLAVQVSYRHVTTGRAKTNGGKLR
jgi:positive regulator of sigma E activity